MRNFIAKNISTVSGEQSGRFTEAERQITEQATRLLQAGASKDQILGAVTALYKVQLFTNYADEYYLGQTGFDMAGGTQEENIAAAQALDARLRGAGLDSAHDRKELMELLLSYQEQTAPLMR